MSSSATKPTPSAPAGPLGGGRLLAAAMALAVAVAAGAVLSWARAMGEFGATITFAGSLQGVTRTLPLEIYLQREVDPAAAVALSLLLVVVAVVVILLTSRRRPAW